MFSKIVQIVQMENSVKAQNKDVTFFFFEKEKND